jgi:hypothetical protein
VASGRWADKAEVNLQVPEGANSFRTEVHNILADHVTAQGTFDVPAGQVPSEKSVLDAINGAIREFRRRS